MEITSETYRRQKIKICRESWIIQEGSQYHLIDPLQSRVTLYEVQFTS